MRANWLGRVHDLSSMSRPSRATLLVELRGAHRPAVTTLVVCVLLTTLFGVRRCAGSAIVALSGLMN